MNFQLYGCTRNTKLFLTNLWNDSINLQLPPQIKYSISSQVALTYHNNFIKANTKLYLKLMESSTDRYQTKQPKDVSLEPGSLLTPIFLFPIFLSYLPYFPLRSLVPG